MNMDFVVGLPRTQRKYDSIWVVVDRLTKSSHFIPVKFTYSKEECARIYINKIVSLHGIPLSIIFDRDSQFTYRVLRSFQKGLDTQVKLCTAFLPQMYGQAERSIQTIKDIVRLV